MLRKRSLERKQKRLCEACIAAANHDGEDLILTLIVVLHKPIKPRILLDLRHHLLKKRQVAFQKHRKD